MVKVSDLWLIKNLNSNYQIDVLILINPVNPYDLTGFFRQRNLVYPVIDKEY